MSVQWLLTRTVNSENPQCSSLLVTKDSKSQENLWHELINLVHLLQLKGVKLDKRNFTLSLHSKKIRIESASKRTLDERLQGAKFDYTCVMQEDKISPYIKELVKRTTKG